MREEAIYMPQISIAFKSQTLSSLGVTFQLLWNLLQIELSSRIVCFQAIGTHIIWLKQPVLNWNLEEIQFKAF